MEKLYKLARGTVRLEISGAEPQKLLNLCAENGIEFWDALPLDDFTVRITCYASSYPDIRTQAARSGCELRLVYSKGGKRIAAAVKRRYALCALLLAGVLLLSASSVFVWNIRVDGNSSISDAELIRALNECGVSYGSFWPSISAERVKNELLLKYPELSWATLNLGGSTAELRVHERVAKPDIVNEKLCADVCAKKAGVIYRMSVLEGKACISEGDTVAAGDILVSGTADSETGDTRFVHAMAVVWARTWYEISAVTPLFEEAKSEINGKSTDISLVLGEKRINFLSDSRNISESCDKIIKYGTASVDGAFTLPLGIISEHLTLYETKTRRIDISAAQTRLEAGLLSRLHDEIGSGRIVSHDFSVSDNGELLIVTLRAECIENIGEETVND